MAGSRRMLGESAAQRRQCAPQTLPAPCRPDVGLTIPATLITNEPAEARTFIQKHGIGRTIYKAFSGTREAWRETRLVKEEEIALVDSGTLRARDLQRYIEATVDLRVTVVGDEVFPAAIFSQQSAYPIDFRMDMANTRIEAHMCQTTWRRCCAT